MSNLKLTDIDYDSIEMETDKAILFLIDDEEVWLPKSTIEIDEKTKTITLPEWLAKKSGL
jgi:hypothetical protein